MLMCLQSCQSQGKPNPKYLGAKFGDFDLDKVTFKENVDSLFSKSKDYFIRAEKNSAFSTKVKREPLKDTVGFQYFLDIETNKSLKVFFFDKRFNDSKCQFITDKNKNLMGVYFSLSVTNEIDIISQIDKKYGKYKVTLTTKNDFSNYQWDTPDKYIGVAVAKYKDGFLYYLLIADKSIGGNKFPINRFSSPIKICLDATCKE